MKYRCTGCQHKPAELCVALGSQQFGIDLRCFLPRVDVRQAGANRSEADYAERLYELMKAFALTILSPGRQTERTLLIVQEQLRPTRSFDVLFKRFIEPLHRAICSALAGLQNRRDDELAVITQGHALVGQALAFVVAQQAYLRRARCTAIGPAEAETISDTIAAMAVAAVRPQVPKPAVLKIL